MKGIGKGSSDSSLVNFKIFSSTGGSLTSSLSSCPLKLSLFLLLSVVSVARIESVPTVDFRYGGENVGNEVDLVKTSTASINWPIAAFLPHKSSSSFYAHHKRSRDVQPVQLCGYRLLEAVRVLCRGNYVGYTKRSDPEVDDEHMPLMRFARDSTSFEEEGERINPSDKAESEENKADGGQKDQQLTRFRRNIIDECCMKACSVNEMLRYCGRN